MKLVIILIFFLSNHALCAKDGLTENDLSFMDQHKKIIKTFSFSELKEKFKSQKISIFNYITQKIEIYNAFDLSQILDQVYGKNLWMNSYAIGTISTDMYAPIIQKHIYEKLKPYLAYERADGEKFENKKSYSKKSISLAPYYIIWKSPKSIGNLKKVRDHWPWKINQIFIIPTEPPELTPSKQELNKGKMTFLNHCIACHSLNNTGGSKSVDLAKVITEKKLDDKYMEEYILDPRTINPKSKMPRFPVYLDNKKEKVQELIKYLRDKSSM